MPFIEMSCVVAAGLYLALRLRKQGEPRRFAVRLLGAGVADISESMRRSSEIFIAARKTSVAKHFKRN